VTPRSAVLVALGQVPDPVSGERKQFASAILPAWCRRSPKINEVPPLLNLHGLSGGDFVPALEQFLAPRPACPRRR
jgi:hypothetical protein